MCACCHDALFSPKGDASDTLPRRHSMEPPSQSSLSPRASDSDLTVTIDPIPDVSAAKSGKASTKPMGYNQVVNKGPDVSDWFRPGSVADFPRAQLQYVKEIGSGWFGTVLEGEASKMTPQKRKMKVVVQILREDLTSMERAYILHTAKMFRDVSHENVLKIVGKCVDKEPYLVLFEHTKADYLKSYLIAQRGLSDDLVHSGAVVKICCDVADGLAALHNSGFVHSDLACRNCLVSNNNGVITVKVGDYGTAFTVFKNEYVTVGDIAVPIRWISPDSVEVAANGQLLTKEVSRIDNVWTLGVVLWEILEFGKIPYMELSDDGVINTVLKNRSAYLQLPLLPLPQRERVYEIMRFCWLPSSTRPSSDEIASLLKHLLHFRPHVDSVDAFDAKWNALVAARRPALLASTNGKQSYSPVPADPATFHDNVQTAAEPQAIRTEKGASPILDKPVNLVTVTATGTPGARHLVGATQQAAAMEVDRERIEKRNFILTLSLADLATLSSRDLADFYEYLSREEITDLEKRHVQATAEAEEATEKRKKRDAFLAMTLDQMEELSAEELGDYMRCLDELDRKETEGKLAKAAEEKRKVQERIQAERNRIFGLSDDQLVTLEDKDFEDMKRMLSNDELRAVKKKVEELKDLERRRRQAQRLLDLDDRDLVQKTEQEISTSYPYLGNDQAEMLKKRHEKLSKMRTTILGASEDELAKLTDGEFDHFVCILALDEAATIKEKRRNGVTKKEILEERRKSVFALSPVDLAKVSWDDLSAFSDVLDEGEAESLRQKRLQALEAREGILSLDGTSLKALSPSQVEGYYRFLTAEEIQNLEKTRAEASLVEERSPSAQGSELAAEALQIARDQLIDMDRQDDAFGSTEDIPEAKSPRKKQHSVGRLVLSSVDLDGGSNAVAPVATPELRMAHHVKRDQILALDHGALRSMPQEEFEDYFQYLSPEEILDLTERRKIQEKNVEVGREDGAKPAAEEFFSGSTWEARDYVLHLSENQLAELEPTQLKQFARFFTSEQFDRIEANWKEARDKREFIKHSTDEELAKLPPEKLEEYLVALPELERAQIRERVNHVFTRLLPATLRDEEAFREILKTVPSISQSESESYGQAPIWKNEPSSLEADEGPEVLISLDGGEANDHRGTRQFGDLFGQTTPKAVVGLSIPEVRFQPATPIHDRSIASDVENERPALTLDLDGLDDQQGDPINTSTPIFETFADSMVDQMGIFGSAQSNASTTYVTARDSLDQSSRTLDQSSFEHSDMHSHDDHNGDFSIVPFSGTITPDSTPKNREAASKFNAAKFRKRRSKSRSPMSSEDEGTTPTREGHVSKEPSLLD